MPTVLESNDSRVQIPKIRAKSLLKSKTCKILISQVVWKVVIVTKHVPSGVFENNLFGEELLDNYRMSN